MKKLITALLTAMLFISSSAYAEVNGALSSLIGTLEITSSRTSANGKLIGCEILYGAMIFDNTYSQGAPYIVKGSLGVNGISNNSNLALGLKVATYRLYPQNNGDVSTKPERPYLAYLKAANGINNVNGYLNKSDSDNMDGGVFYVYKFDARLADILGQMSNTKTISIVFNRREGGYDVVVPIDLTVTSVNDKGVRTHSDKNMYEFSTCYSDLLNSVADNIDENKPK
jgi:hypothetical protein